MIRWLQELYPGDELLAAALGLPLDAVTMVEHEGPGAETYAALAYDAAGRELDRLTFSPRCYARPYLDAFPDQGAVLATTGAVVARSERKRRAYTPDEVRARLHERAATVQSGKPERGGRA